MKSINRICLLFVIGFLFSFGMSCSDWEQEIQIPDTKITDSKRVVVIEEFTGASCVNCPAGIAASAAVLDLYPNNVIVIGVHSKFLAQPATAGQVDLRAPDAQLIEAFLGSWLAKPESAINRLYDDANQTYRYGTPDSWQSIVEAELKKAPKIDLSISGVYDENSRELIVKLTMNALEAINEAVHIHCGITESNIIADQLDNFSKLIDFNHTHVLRKMLSPIPGEKIADVISSGQSFTKEYRFTLPQDAILWKAENCSIFAYVSLNENKKYILQAAEKKVK